VLDYLWGSPAKAFFAAAISHGSGEAAPRIRYVNIGSMAGASIALGGAALRSSGVELIGSGLGSVSHAALLRCISDLMRVAVPARLHISAEPVKLSEVEAAWVRPAAERIVFVSGAHKVAQAANGRAKMPRMARRGDELRNHVLSAARGVFLEMGFERASMDEVASRAQTTKRSLYAHFESKEKLFLAVIDRQRGRFLERLKVPEAYSSRPAEALGQFCGRYIEVIIYEPSVQMLRVTMAETTRFPEAAAQHYDVMFVEVSTRVALVRRRASGEREETGLAFRVQNAGDGVVHPVVGDARIVRDRRDCRLPVVPRCPRKGPECLVEARGQDLARLDLGDLVHEHGVT
jgi:AcrR family transcriptional regulator